MSTVISLGKGCSLGKGISRQAQFRLLAILLSLMVGLIVSEVFLRLINYHPAIVDPMIYVVGNNEILPYKLRPYYRGYYLGQEIQTDADGYRVVSPNYHLMPAGCSEVPAKVILILGDSMVFGYGLRNEDTIASQLQNFLWSRNLNYQVKSVGAPGYSSWNEYAAFDEYLKKHSATDVILTYNPNDITFDNDYFGIGEGKRASFSDTRFHRLTQFLYTHVYTFFLISDTLKKVFAYFKRELKPGAANEFAEQYNQPAIDYSMKALSKIQDLCRQHQIKLSVGIYRDAAAHQRALENSLKYEETIKKNLDERGVRSFLIKSHVDHLTINEALVFWNDPHPSPKAVSFIVADIFKEVE